MQTFPVDSGFIGIDTYTSPESVEAGRVVALSNLQVEGSSKEGMGYLVPRPGKQGQLTTAFGAGVYALSSFVNAAGQSKLLYTTGGRLYVMNPGDAAGTEITNGGASMGLASATTQFVQAGTRIFIVDGTGSLKWTDLSAGHVYAGLTTPQAPLIVSGTSAAKLAGMGARTWTQDSFTPTGELVTNTNCSNSDVVTGDAWSYLGSSSGSASQNGDGGVWIDQASDAAKSAPIIVPHRVTTTSSYAKLFNLSFEICGGTSNPSTIDPNDTTLIVYNNADGADIHETGRKTFRDVPSGSQGQKIEHLFDFSDVTSEIVAVRILFSMFSDRHFKGVVINHVHLSCPQQAFQLIPNSTTGQLDIARGTVQMTDNILKTAGLELRTDLTAGQNWSNDNRLVLKLSAPGVTDTALVKVQLFFQQGSTKSYTNNLDLSIGGGQAFIDISTLTAGQRNPFQYLGLRFVSDLPMTDSNQNSSGTVVLSLGDIITPGNLSIGTAPYEYLRVEVDGSYDAANLFDVIESDGSTASSPLTPTATQAEASVILPAYTNGAAGYEKLYRRGGTFRDSFFRLVAMLPLGQATFAMSAAPNVGTAPYYALPSNPYISYVSGTRTLTDNTPDSYLEGADIYTPGRLPPPVGASCAADWLGRLAVSVGNELYISWPITGNAVYFSVIDNPTDPAFESEGFHDFVGGKNGDIIQHLTAYEDRLLIFKKINSPWIMTGTDPSNWQLFEYKGQSGQGMAALNCAALFNDSVYYLSPSGVLAFDGVHTFSASQHLIGVLNPERIGQTPLTQSAYAKCKLFSWLDDYLFLLAPVAGDSTPSVLYRFNRITNEWDGVWGNMAITSAASVPHPGQTNDLFVAGSDGQVYKMTGTADKATPSAGNVAIACSVTTRKLGLQVRHYLASAGQLGFVNTKVAQRLYPVVSAGSTTLVVTSTVKGDDPALAYPVVFTLAAGKGIRKPLKVHSRVRGRCFDVTMTFSCIDRPKVYGIGVQATWGGQSLASF